MNKAILVIDMPESCEKCPLFHGFYTDMTCGANNYGIDYPYPKDFRQDWCPLKPLPNKKTGFQYADGYDYCDGWNECIDKILSDQK